MKNKQRLFWVILILLSFPVGYAQQGVTPETALMHYLNNNDHTYAWEVRERFQINDVEAYSVLFISQKWQKMLWKHEMIIFVPQAVAHDGALLFITGGSLRNGIPNLVNKNEETVQFMAELARRNSAVTVLLHQVPNQPLYDGLTEDALITPGRYFSR
jgi:PhoPQ-activated pathogenicity-related protein